MVNRMPASNLLAVRRHTYQNEVQCTVDIARFNVAGGIKAR